jgi:hypothetical protein
MAGKIISQSWEAGEQISHNILEMTNKNSLEDPQMGAWH